ncbi:MAG: hypothetical protein EBR09_06700 [Proteobacteria bacterium]|nr:hypothetical protein [Pseudomonadota bacterium]
MRVCNFFAAGLFFPIFCVSPSGSASENPPAAVAVEGKEISSQLSSQKVGAVQNGPAGEGKTLPKNVVRLRIPLRSVSSSQGFASNGQKSETGLKLSVLSGALVFEYGYTDAISFQLVAPFVFRNEMSMSGSAFQKSFIFHEKYEEFIAAAASKLVTDGLCSNLAVCLDAIQNKGLSLPATADLTLPTGEKLTVRAGVPLKDVASSLVTRAAIPAAGRTGMGDLEAGVLVALADPQTGLWKKDWPVNLSLGLGLRSPSGSFADVPAAQRGTGRGTWDLGLRTNVDWHPAAGWVVSFQNQWEEMLLSGVKKRTSLLDSSKLNSADPLIDGGDKVANAAKYERSGARQAGFLKVAAGAGGIVQALEPVVFSMQWKYDFDPKTLRGGLTETADSELQSALAGIMFDGLKLQFPAQLDLEYELPLSGKNRRVAPRVLTATMKAYYRF